MGRNRYVFVQQVKNSTSKVMIKCAFDAFLNALHAPLNINQVCFISSQSIMEKGAVKPSLPVVGNLSCSYCAAKKHEVMNGRQLTGGYLNNPHCILQLHSLYIFPDISEI